MPKELKKFEEWPFKVPSIKGTVKKVNVLTEEFKNAKSEKEALAIWKKMSKLVDNLSNEIIHVQVLFSCYTQNAKYKKAMDALDEGIPLIENASKAFEKELLASPYRPYLEEKLGKFLFTKLEVSQKGFDEKIIPELIEESKLTTKYGALIAGTKVEYKGETYNLPQMSLFRTSLDRNVRKEADEAYYNALSGIRGEVEDIYDQLVHLRDTMAKKLGYKNFVELGYIRMGRYDYSVKDVEAYREEIRKSVTPIVTKLLKEQFKRTGIKNPQAYDLNLTFKDGNPNPRGTTAEKIELAKKMYDELSPDTSFFFRYLADHNVLDLEAREGKQSGGYMTYFPKYRIPFIFSNFNGTAGDVDVLTHEFGHAFQAYMARNIKIPEYRAPTMESCEIHSMSMEFIAEPWMELFFEDAKKYRFLHLSDSISFLPYGVTVDEYQQWVYENPNCTKEERNAKWHELEEKYTPGIVGPYSTNEYLRNGGRWITQAHIIESPFYYIDYTLAQVMAFQFFNLDRKNHGLAWKRYLNLCKMGGKYPFRTLVTKAHMKDPFQPGVVKKTIAPLVKVLKSYNF